VNNIYLRLQHPDIIETALKNTLFVGLDKLMDKQIDFDLYYLNQWRIETIYDMIKRSSEEHQKPTKKEFVCCLNRILTKEYIDSNKHEQTLSGYIDVPTTIDYRMLPVNDNILDNILTHPSISLNFDAPILYMHVFIMMSNYNERIITPKIFTANEQDINELEPEMQLPMREVHKF
jgi:hypothetical protein